MGKLQLQVCSTRSLEKTKDVAQSCNDAFGIQAMTCSNEHEQRNIAETKLVRSAASYWESVHIKGFVKTINIVVPMTAPTFVFILHLACSVLRRNVRW